MTNLRLETWARRISLASVAPLLNFGSRFARTVFLSRLLAPDEFGISVAIMVVIATAEQVCDVGVNNIVLLKSGEEGRRVLAAAHRLLIFRGFLLGAVLALLSKPMAAFFGVPDHWGSFLIAGLIPLARSYAHLGVVQAQREYNYRPQAVCALGSNFASLAGALIAIAMLHDHRAILVSAGCEALVFVALSHALAPTRYQFSTDAATLRQVLRYGLPLMLNGAGLAIIGQADRFFVGAAFGVETLGLYAVILSLALVPITPIFELTGTLGTSMLARTEHDEKKRVASSIWLIWFFSLLGFAYAAGVGLTLDVATPLIFGPSYIVPLEVRAIIVAIVFLRILRGAPTLILICSGGTLQLAIANISAGVGLLAAAALVQFHPMLSAVLLGILLGDLLSVTVFLYAAARYVQRRLGSILAAAGAGAVSVLLLIALIVLLPVPDWGERFVIALACVPPAAALLWNLHRQWKLRQAV